MPVCSLAGLRRGGCGGQRGHSSCTRPGRGCRTPGWTKDAHARPRWGRRWGGAVALKPAGRRSIAAPGAPRCRSFRNPGPGSPGSKLHTCLRLHPAERLARAVDPRPAVSPAASDGKRPLRLVAGAEGKRCPAPSARLPGGTWAGCSRQHKAGAPNPHPGIGESGPQRETGRRLAFPRLGREGTASVPCQTRTQSSVPPRLRAGTDSGQGTCHPVTAATGRSGVRLRTRTLQVWLDQAPRSS